MVVCSVAALGLVGCSSSAPGPGAASPVASGPIKAPLNATLTIATPTGTGTVAVVPMGMLGDPLNTFWQLFFRPAGASRWVLVTPPGVADNGGLVLARDPDPATANAVLAGFEPSQHLDFSPLALSGNQGASWSPGLVSEALASVPDALSASATGGLVALVRTGGGAVLRSAGNISTWTELVSRDALASTTAGRSCGAGDLSAVALVPSVGVEVGTTCRASGVVGIFGRRAGSWHLVGPRLSGQSGPAPTQVLRLVDAGATTSALVAVGAKSGTNLVAVTATAGGAWSRSPPLPLRPGTRVVSTGVGAGGGYVVLVGGPKRSLALDTETVPGGDWQARPAPPPGTEAVAAGADGEIDALGVASTVFTRLAARRLG